MVTQAEFQALLVYTGFVGVFIWMTSITTLQFRRFWRVFAAEESKKVLKVPWFHVDFFWWSMARAVAGVLLVPAIYFNVQRNPIGVAAHHKNWEIASFTMYASILASAISSVALHHGYNIEISMLFSAVQGATAITSLAYLGILGSYDTNSYTSFWFFITWAVVSSLYSLAIANVYMASRSKLLFRRFWNLDASIEDADSKYIRGMSADK